MRKNRFWGGLLVFIGIIWLMGSQNWIHFNLLDSFVKLWPLLLLVVGIKFIFGRDSKIHSLAWVATFLAIVVYAWLLGSSGGMNFVKDAEIYEFNKNTTETANMTLNLGSADVRISGGSNALAEIKSNIPKIKARYMEGSKADLTYSIANSGIGLGSLDGNFSADVNTSIPWNFIFNLAAINSVLHFEDLNVPSCDFNIASGDMEIQAGSMQKEMKINVNAVSANMVINVPKGTGVRIDANGLDTKIRIPNIPYEHTNQTYETSNFEQAEHKIILNMKVVHCEVLVNER